MVVNNTLNKNIFANIFGTGWSIFSVYLFLPFYLKLLGEEAYGLVMFSSSIQAVIFLFDAGFSATLRRELSIDSTNLAIGVNKIGLVKTVEKFYGVIFIVISVLAYLFSSWAALHWFHFNELTFNEVKWAIFLMSLNALLQMQSSLYQGSFMALNRQLQANLMQFIYTFLRNGMVIVVLFYYPSVLSFLSWQLIVSVFYFLVSRKLLFSHLKSTKSDSLNFKETNLKQIWKISSLFLIISLLSTVNLQVDKIIISKLLEIKNIGFYNTAYTLGQLLVSICGPIAAALTPVLIKSYSNNNFDQVSILFHKYAKLGNLLSGTLAVVMITNSYQIILIWTGNQNFSNQTAPLVPYMLLAGLFLSSQVIPYTLAIASADLKPIIFTCIINIAITIPMYLYLGKSMGMKGIAVVWCISNIFMMFVNVYYFLRKILKKEYIMWVLNDFLMPIFISGIITICISFIRPQSANPYLELGSIGLLFISSLAISTFIVFRNDLVRLYNNFKSDENA